MFDSAGHPCFRILVDTFQSLSLADEAEEAEDKPNRMTFQTHNANIEQHKDRQNSHRDSDIFASQSSSDDEEESKQPSVLVNRSQSHIASFDIANGENHKTSTTFNTLAGKILNVTKPLS